jgi:hypothetical protein
MKASSVGEYLILFGALIAVVATAVISLGRLVVFQAETAEERYSQSLADELASVINEVSASPDGAYYVLEPTRTRYNITISETRVVLDKGGDKVVATHLGRRVVPTNLDSTDNLCIQKSLGKISVKSGDCLNCVEGDGFCDAGCDALGRCDADCIVSNDSYCSKSCSVFFDYRCDLDCVGESDGIWDPDCGCILGSTDPCVEDDVCDTDSGVLDFAWDPECTTTEVNGVCDPDYDIGCDPDCVSDVVCRGTCASDPSICFPACNNPVCQNCVSECAPGCSSQPAGWDSEFSCRGKIPEFEESYTYPMFLKIDPQVVEQNCNISATEFQIFYFGEEEPAGIFYEGGYTYLVYSPKSTEGYVYFDEGNYKSISMTDIWAGEGTMVNEFLKIKVENGTITEFKELGGDTQISVKWGDYKGEGTLIETITSSDLNVAEIEVDYNSNYKRYQMFSGLPGVRLISDYDTPAYYEFPLGYEVSSDINFAYVSGDVNLMLYCNGASIVADPEDRELYCTSGEIWIFVCTNCQPLKNWVYDRETEPDEFTIIENVTGYSEYC